MSDPGNDALIADLKSKPECFDRNELIVAASRDKFHDFKSPYDAPKVELVRRLRAAGYKDLAEKAIRGAYDQGREAAQEWAESDEGREIIGQFRGK